MKHINKYVGLDVHKETIAVGISDSKGGPPRYYGEILNKPEALKKMVGKMAEKNGSPSFSYEAGPTGYGTYRQIRDMGFECIVVAPSLIPSKPGERVKTDRRDCLSLSRLYRAGELTAVWVPDEEQEAMRDLTRAREDLKNMERMAKQRLCAFLLRHNRIYTGKSKWTKAHFYWFEKVKFEFPIQQIVFQEYLDTVKDIKTRVSGLTEEMEKALDSWRWGSVVEALMSLRGCKLITAMTVIAEIGDLTRFESPRSLMAYLGLVPSEHSSGKTQRRGGITKTGNSHVRRVLVEAAWCYRFPARKTAHIRRRAEKSSESAQKIAWKAQKRLCGPL